MIAPAHQSHSPQYIPAPMTATYEEVRAAQGPTYTVTITRDAQTFIDGRYAALAAIKVTIPDRAQAEERAAMAVACAVEDTWNSVLAELRNLYPTND